MLNFLETEPKTMPELIQHSRQSTEFQYILPALNNLIRGRARGIEAASTVSSFSHLLRGSYRVSPESLHTATASVGWLQV